jgi:dynein heavy chain
MAGPPSLVYAGFEGGESMSQKNLEQARCKFLLDKLTGKLPQELKGGMGRALPPIPGSASDTASQRSAQKEALAKMEDTPQEETKGEIEKKKPQQWSELDKFIELLLDSKSDEETVFLYLRHNDSGDPYDLQVTTYTDAGDKHYTLSSKGITEYENKVPKEFLSLGQWLIERDSYNHIKTYRFFSQFKKWKFMRMWKKTIKHKYRITAQNHLDDKLFILQDTFRQHLMKHRELMLQMSTVRFVDQCRTGETKDIDQFTTAQMSMIKRAKKSITDMSNQSRENIQKCIEKVLHELRNQIMDDMSMDEDRKKQSPVGGGNTMSMKRKESNNTFEKLGFPSGMTYGHRSSLRKECARFLRFAWLADFLSLDALSKIYLGSVQKMIDRLDDLNESIDMEKIMSVEFDEEGGGGGSMTAQRG